MPGSATGGAAYRKRFYIEASASEHETDHDGATFPRRFCFLNYPGQARQMRWVESHNASRRFPIEKDFAAFFPGSIENRVCYSQPIAPPFRSAMGRLHEVLSAASWPLVVCDWPLSGYLLPTTCREFFLTFRHERFPIKSRGEFVSSSGYRD